MFKEEQSIQELWPNIKHINIYENGVQKKDIKENKIEKKKYLRYL